MGIKAGAIGAGGMAQYYIADFRQAGAEGVAIADIYGPATKAATGKLVISSTLGSAEALLAIDEIERLFGIDGLYGSANTGRAMEC